MSPCQPRSEISACIKKDATSYFVHDLATAANGIGGLSAKHVYESCAYENLVPVEPQRYITKRCQTDEACEESELLAYPPDIPGTNTAALSCRDGHKRAFSLQASAFCMPELYVPQ